MDSLPLPKLVWNVFWISISALQYGFHISSLNAAAESIICSPDNLPSSKWGGPSCINLSEFEFGCVTSAYTVGGLVASLNTGHLIEKWGQRKTAERAAWAVFLGSTMITLAQSFWILTLGRIVIGLSCGVATVLVPLYLKSVSPPAIAGGIGILCQISINVGILTAQGVSIPLSNPGDGQWRKIPFLSLFLAAFQIGTSWLVVSPSTTSTQPYETLPSRDIDEERAPFVNNTTSPTSPTDASSSRNPLRMTPSSGLAKTLSVKDVVTSKEESIRKPLWALVAIMLFQQLSGINAVMFYSVKILTAVNPGSAKKTALFVTIVNLLMTFPAIYLIDRIGRRQLILISLTTMSISSIVLGYSINAEYFTLASVGIMAFVVSFALGLGPVPFVLLGELPKDEAKSATASIAVATNWISNLLIGIIFLPLRDFLASFSSSPTSSSTPSQGSGTVFYVFATISAVGTIVVGRLMR